MSSVTMSTSQLLAAKMLVAKILVANIPRTTSKVPFFNFFKVLKLYDKYV